MYSSIKIIVILLIVSCLRKIEATILAGVTINSPPFVMIENNRFSGLCIDLMDEIHRRSGLKYSLYLVGDHQYGPGPMRDGVMTGMIGDVFNKKADFAIADLTVAPYRERYVTFSEPFFTFSISALVKRTAAVKNLRTLDDLAIKSNLSIGTYGSGYTLERMQRLRKDVRTIRWLYNRIALNHSNLVHTIDEAMQKVHNGSFAFLQEAPRNIYRSIKDCSLTVLSDPNYYALGQYAISFRQDSPYIGVFNRTIHQLRKEGFMEQLKKRYFTNHCSNSTSIQTRPSFITIMFHFSLIISYFTIKRFYYH